MQQLLKNRPQKKYPTVEPTAKADEHQSIFRVTVYFNRVHYGSGTQLIKTYYSIDTIRERNCPTPFKPKEQYHGFIKLKEFLAKLALNGDLWHAVICSNRVKDANGRPMMLEQLDPDPMPEQRFGNNNQFKAAIPDFSMDRVITTNQDSK